MTDIIIAPTFQAGMRYCGANGLNYQKVVILDTTNPVPLVLKRLQGVESGHARVVNTHGYDKYKLPIILEALDNHPGSFELETVFL